MSLIARPDIPLPSDAALDRARSELDRRLGPSKLLADRAACEAYAGDDSDVEGVIPAAVVLATSADDVAAALEIAERHAVPVTPRGGGTGRVGGAVPVAGGIVLAMQGLAQLKELSRDDLVAVVEPGLVLANFQAACEAEGLFFPPDPSSLDTCQLGGNVATNAGGPRAFKYGVVRDYVLGLEVALLGGRRVRTGRRTIKGVTGYDLTSLLVGSEGTLGVFTELVLRLVPRPPAIGTVLALFDGVHAAARATTSLVAARIVPRCLELLDEATLQAVRAQGVAVDGRARALLLVEVDGDEGEVERGLSRLGEVLSGASGVVDLVAAQDEAQRARLWAARRSLSTATRKLAKYKLSEDVVVPRSRIAELLERVERIGERTSVRHLAYGHAGDGNLHVNFLWDDDAERPAVDRAIAELMVATVELSGTLSGEHGIGVSKARFLPLEQSSALIDLERDVKRAFDPRGLLNPGKIFPASAPGSQASEAVFSG